MSEFEHYVDLIRDPTVSFAGSPLSSRFLVSAEGRFQTFYAPFDHINTKAKVFICGITPGAQQAMNALQEARRSLLRGESMGVAKAKAKQYASFSGPMRPNLVAMLDHIGLHTVLGIDSCELLFSSHSHLAHYTSTLRNPVFRDGKNYSGTPSIVKQPSLLKQIDKQLTAEIQAFGPDCIFVPLGSEVSKVFDHLQAKGAVKASQVLGGMLHPSPASNERIAYFLGRKERTELSPKTNATIIDKNKAAILEKITALKTAS
jgi:hypothetical protein